MGVCSLICAVDSHSLRLSESLTVSQAGESVVTLLNAVGNRET